MNKLLLIGAGTGGGVVPATGDDFFAASGASAPFSNAHGPSAQHYANTNTTWFAWTATSPPGVLGRPHVRVKTFNHTIGKWSPEYVAGLFGLSNDVHGSPSQPCRDNDGYIHIVYGNHAQSPGFTRHCVTLNPNDPTVWREGPSITGSHTYQKLVNVGGTLYRISSDSTVANDHTVALVTTTGISGGIPTWGPKKILISLSTGGTHPAWVYVGNTVVRGTDIHFCVARNEYPAMLREHVIYYVYDTITGAVRNYENTTTVASGSLPVNELTSYQDFMIFASPQGNVTHIPQLIFDSNDNPHVIFTDGPTNTQQVKHIWHNGITWQEPDIITGAVMTFQNDSMGGYQMADGQIAAMWPQDESSLWADGGNIRRAVWTPGVGWGAAQTILIATTYPLDSPIGTQQPSHKDARAMACENEMGEDPLHNGTLKLYAFQEDGSFLKHPPVVHIPVNVEAADTADRFTVPPSGQYLGFLDAIITQIKDIGLSEFDAYYIFCGETAQASCQNIIQNQFNLTQVNSPTFVATKGFTGGTGYLTSTFIPSTAGGALSQNQAHMACMTRLTDDNDAVIMGCTDGTRALVLTPRTGANQRAFKINDNTTSSAASANAGGFLLVNRSASNALQADSQGVQIGTSTVASVGLPTQPIFALTNNASGTPGTISTNTVALMHWGGSLDLTQRLKAYNLAKRIELSRGSS